MAGPGNARRHRSLENQLARRRSIGHRDDLVRPVKGGDRTRTMKVTLVAMAAIAAPVAVIGSTALPAAQPQNLPGKSATATAIVGYLNSLTNRRTATLISGQHDQTNEITSAETLR